MQPKNLQASGTTGTPSDLIPYITGQRSGEDAVFQFKLCYSNKTIHPLDLQFHYTHAACHGADASVDV